jgi:prepilin-type processing-associated H-X9-DG protein
VVTVIMILGALLLSWIVDQRERSRRADRIRCISNLKLVGLSFRIFATDNNDQYPGALLATNEAVRGSVTAVDIIRSLSNELSTPKLIVCPADTKKEATNFASLSALNISYFASLSASETNPTAFLAGDRNVMVDGRLGAGLVKLTTNAVVGWSAELHNGQGNICMADGSVQQFSSNRLKHELRTQPIGTNYLVFP